ncbi:glycoside hydrolase [Cerioporus squamosus]|nr:glycoside hydrolase [Cerioporus squamosus]
MFVSAAVVALAVGVSQVAAHGGVLSYSINGQTYDGFLAYNKPAGQSSIQREWDTFSPITDVTDPHLACNTNGATAGSKVTAYWNDWGHSIGPVMVYMANCNGACTSSTPSSLNWFKIDEAGLISGSLPSGLWGMGELVANNSSWTSTIPSSLAPGEYFIRHELLALHSSYQPQFYPECAQLIVTGSGSAQPSGSYLVKIPGAYSMSDPGVGIDVYNQPNVLNYTIPGPPVWHG